MIKSLKFESMLCVLFVAILCTMLNTSKVSAVDFKQIDYIERLKSHPIYKNYDPQTGRFKNTRSEIVPVEVLNEKRQGITDKIKELNKEKGGLVKDSLLLSIDSSQNDSWEKIAAIDKEIAELELQLPELEELIDNGGIPYTGEVPIIITQIFNEIREDYLKGTSSDTIILNKLPLYRKNALKPEVDNYNSGYFDFLNSKNTGSLNNYVEFGSHIGLLFQSTSETIIYKKGDYDKK